jgi:stress-induced morphogen
MIEPEQIHEALIKQLPGAEITVQDLTGTRDHYEVLVMWSGFNGKSLIEQHKIVNNALADKLEDGRIHALKIKTIKAS